MADAMLSDHLQDNTHNLLQNDFDLLPIPPLHPEILTDDLSFPENLISDLCFDLDIDFTSEDLRFAENLLCDPDLDSNSASPEPPISDNSSSISHQPIPNPGSVSPDAKGALTYNQCLIVDRGSNCEVNPVCEETRAPNLWPESCTGDRGSDVAGDTSYRSSGANFNQKLDCPSPESGSCNQESSHCSGDRNSGISQPVSSPSLETGHSDRDVSSSVGTLLHRYSKVKNEDAKGVSKRKKEQEDLNCETRTSKCRRSSTVLQENNAGSYLGSEDDEKRKARLMRNRESAQLSRQRKKQYVEELEDKVRTMHSTITELNGKISFVMAENASLRQQLTGGGACPTPPPGMYPMMPSPMGYPWMPCAQFVVKPQGSQVPLVPIPRLKPQQPVPAPKINKKLESKKSEGKTKKVASISFLGLLFFMLLFGGLVPVVNVRFGGIGGANVSDRFSDSHKDKVLIVNGNISGSGMDHGGTMGYSVGNFGYKNDEYCEGAQCQRLNSNRGQQEQGTKFKSGPDGSAAVGNASEPLVASLYVPRNDKLVKIDGNLIIHSIMATEKARASSSNGGMKANEETSLAIAKNYAHPCPIPGVGGNTGRNSQLDKDASGRHRAISSGSADDLKSSTTDGKLQEWFREGLAGPLLSSGVCTEVFQFDVSPAAGAIVPAAYVANSTTSEVCQNTTQLNKARNRRFLHGRPIPLDGRVQNVTKEQVELNAGKDGFLPRGNSSRSSMVISVLVDPREEGDGDGEGVIGSKTPSRIFVVVLVDSVKYVTYSCTLPRMGSGPHLVAT